MMKQQGWQNIIFNACIALNCLLVCLLIFEDRFIVPVFLQAFGRAHPLILHFPIVLLLLAFLFEMLMALPKQAMLKNIADWLLLAAALTTVVAALMGLFLSKEEGYEGDAIDIHKWAGVACAFIGFIWYGLREQIRKKKIATIIIGSCATVVLLITGHKGANITHGEDFLLSPILASKEQPPVPLEDAVIYSHLVQPIIEKKCMSCHNTGKAKGELIMETRELLLKGGKNGKLWDTAAVDLGLMMQRIHLPLEDEEHMPPKGKSQLTEDEIRVLQLWIKNGASFTKKVIELPRNNSLRVLAAAFFKPSGAEVYDFAAVDENAIAQLNTEYRVITSLSAESPALAVNFYGIEQFKSEQLKDLTKIKDNIVSLHLAKMPVKDEDLKVIGDFSNLRDLNLAFTAIKGEGLKHLTGLKHLKQISLSGTGIAIGQLKPLAQLKRLQSIKLWNTPVSDMDAASLKAGFHNVSFDLGYKGDTIIARLPVPFITADKDKKIFSDTTIITIKNPIGGATTRYTLDGSEPDSIHSPVYKKPFSINKSVVVNARSFLKGWTSSDNVSAGFYRSSIKPDNVYLATVPDPRHINKAKKGQAFFDETLGDTNYNTWDWIGYKKNIFELHLFFNKPVNISSVNLNALVDTENHILPPADIQIWGGENMGTAKLLARSRPGQPNSSVPPYIESYSISFQAGKVQAIKIIVQQVKSLPAWHPDKSQKAWVFFDEIFLN
ncbi:MAG: chitobiase/beta-hexosaminidase C-terminal domain-containing protein [Niabella sp.]